MDYKIECIDFLLNEDCILSRYYPLISFKGKIIEFANEKGTKSKDEMYLVSDAELNEIFNDFDLVKLFRLFLTMYDTKTSKLNELEKLELSEEELKSFRELFLLPGVKETRARLYYLSGFKSLRDIANSSVDDILKKCGDTIIRNNLDYKAPLTKEIKTHIAVSKAFISMK